MVLPGQLFARKYRIERVLGRGGMGVVALAWHIGLEIFVALKLLGDARAPPAATERLLREGKAAARLRSEHVARVLDSGVHEGAPFLVMEYVQGHDLAERLARCGALPAVEAVDLVLQACEAIAEAHALGIVHRDIKPANLMLTERADGSPLVKVLDFGIARNLTDAGPSLTGSTLLLGSPRYMSPEQVRDAGAASPRSDVWSLAVTLYELLTGRAPFDGPTAPGILAQIAADPPVPPRQLRPELPEALDALLLRCLAKPPAERPADAQELASLLAPFGSETGQLAARRIPAVVERARCPHDPAALPPDAPDALPDDAPSPAAPDTTAALLSMASDTTAPPWRPASDTTASPWRPALDTTAEASSPPAPVSAAVPSPLAARGALLGLLALVSLGLLAALWPRPAPAVPSSAAGALPSSPAPRGSSSAPLASARAGPPPAAVSAASSARGAPRPIDDDLGPRL